MQLEIRQPHSGMSSQVTLDMLKGAGTEDFPVCSVTNPAKYPPITYGEYRVWWLNNNYRAKLAEA
jgi:hypothetical protein